MNRIIISALVLSGMTANAQVKNGMVGINTDEPRATMHIEPGVSESKGLIIPRITAAQMKTMTSLAHFGADHHAIITYLKETLPAADRTGKLVDVADPGYYYYDNTTGVQKWKTFGGAEQDLRMVGTNHLTKEAGVGFNGSNMGTGGFNIGIGAVTYNLANNNTSMSGFGNIALGRLIYTAPNTGTMSGSENTAIGRQLFQMQNGNLAGYNNIGMGTGLYIMQSGNMASGSNIALGGNIYTFNKTTGAVFTGGGNTSIGQTIFALTDGDLTGGNNIGMGQAQYTLTSGNMAGSRNIGIGQNSYYVLNGDITGTATDNIALGSNIYRLNNTSTSTFSGARNIGIGQQMYISNGDITGNSNIGIGNGSLYAGAGGLTGSNNIAMGNSSLGGIVAVSGSNNIALGNSAMYSNGYSVTGNKNIAIGGQALFANGIDVQGDNNIAIGENALFTNGSSRGNENIGIGTGSGAYLGLGNGNVFLGNRGLNTDTPQIDNVIAIGHGISLPWSTPDNVILLGNNNPTNAPKIGMGNYQPQSKLDVNGEVRVGNEGGNCTSSNRGAIRFDGNHFYGCTPLGWKQLDN